jgi:hypothetical protein
VEHLLPLSASTQGLHGSEVDPARDVLLPPNPAAVERSATSPTASARHCAASRSNRATNPGRDGRAAIVTRTGANEHQVRRIPQSMERPCNLCIFRTIGLAGRAQPRRWWREAASRCTIGQGPGSSRRGRPHLPGGGEPQRSPGRSRCRSGGSHLPGGVLDSPTRLPLARAGAPGAARRPHSVGGLRQGLAPSRPDGSGASDLFELQLHSSFPLSFSILPNPGRTDHYVRRTRPGTGGL